MTTRRQLLRSAGALAPAMILPPALLATKESSAALGTAGLEEAKMIWPSSYTVNEPLGFPGLHITVSRQAIDIYRVRNLVTVVQQQSYAPTLQSWQYDCVSYFGTPQFGSNPAGKSFLYHRANGAQVMYPRGALPAALPVNSTTFEPKPRGTCDGRCLQPAQRNVLFRNVVPAVCYTIQAGFAATNIDSSAGLSSWWSGFKSFVGTYYGVRRNLSKYWCWDAVNMQWMWIIIDRDDPRIGTFVYSMGAVLGRAATASNRMMLATGATLGVNGVILSALTVAHALSYDSQSISSTQVLSLAFATASVGLYAATMHQDIKVIKNSNSDLWLGMNKLFKEGFVIASGVVAGTGGDYDSLDHEDIETGPPIQYDALEVSGLSRQTGDAWSVSA
jgi:hypothetical protein